MSRAIRSLFALVFIGVSLIGLHAADRFELQNGDRVLFIGDTFFEREVDYGSIETRLTAAFPEHAVTFRNLGWAGDSPMGRARASFDWNNSETEWLKRVKEQLALVKPTVAFLSYGMTAALEAAEAKSPEDQQALMARFKSGMTQLMAAIDEVSGQKVRFVLLSPIPQEASPGVGNAELAAHNSLLGTYTAAIEQLASGHGARFVPMLAVGRDAHGLYGTSSVSQFGVVLGPKGYQRAAEVVAESLGLPKSGGAAEARERLQAAIVKKNELFFHRWRPENWTYIFGFRKHEQGQNAVEIPRFDPLIEEWDGVIAGLRNLDRPDPNTVTRVDAALGTSTRETEQKRFVGRNRIADEALKAQSAAPKPRAPQPIPTFDVADGFEVSLWAENPLLHKPIQMNWDSQGRLWVASSEVYPQIKPGQPATDSIVVLEDTTGSGKADKHTVFAGGLLIPTGVLPDNRGGVYVAASSQLLHFADTQGTGHADQKTVVLSSFGTEDTHHNLHTLRWGYDGHLYLNQSIYTHTHIETPFGVRRLNSAGIWRFNPDTGSMSIFTKGGCNPWGHHWDQFGNSFFTDGAGGKGVYHAMEGATYFTYSDMRREADSISPGSYPKFASLELVHSPNFPADWQGSAITCDFRAHRVVHFAMTEVGSTFQTREMPDLLRSTNVTFRPIDLRFGPDGALYVADWSNPIIQHGEVDFRDPRRDKEHGRIWRIAARQGTVAVRQNLNRLSVTELLDRTLSASGWEQEQSRAVLRQRGSDKVLPSVKSWLARQLDPRAKLEAMWIYEAFEKPNDAILAEVIASPDGHVRTAAARQLSR
jgi:glucose/arabinose dehydrogenase